MAYIATTDDCYHCPHCRAHDLRMAAKAIGDAIGINISIIPGGPSVSDPCGLISYYIGLRDKYGAAISFSVSHDEHLGLMGIKESKKGET